MTWFRSCGSGCPSLGLSRPSHKSLLDLLVRTDTDFGVSRGSRGCVTPICRFCGKPFSVCRCGYDE